MQSEEQYMERTPDLVAKVRAMREAAEKEMNRFTRAADYDVRRVVGHGPKAAPVSPAVERPKRSTTRSSTAQTAIEFAPAPPERDDDGEDS
jgi:hypothetical protein